MLLQDLEGHSIGDLLVRIRAANSDSRLPSLERRWKGITNITGPTIDELRELEEQMKESGIDGADGFLDWKDELLYF